MKRLICFAMLVLMACSFSLGGTLPIDPDGVARLDFRKVINESKEKVFPAVVFIKCVRENFDQGKRTASEAAGSGVLISGAGELLTNWHVIEKAIEIRCLLSDGRAMDGKLVGSDKDTDLALVQLVVPANSAPIPYATLGDSKSLKEGDFVMAMGAPWGLSRSVSMGIISCTNRFLPECSEYSLWLQTDAAICPGNSGGPLVNTTGEVIGINARGTMIAGDMGFAIPSQTISELLPRLREHGQVQWSWFGLQLQPRKDFNRNMYFEGADGVIVADVDPDSPARTIGLQARDRLISVNGMSLNGATEEDLPSIRRALGLLSREKPAQLKILRNGQAQELALLPSAKGKVQGEEYDCPRWDFTVKAINRFDNPDLFFHRDRGVFVNGIKRPGNAGESGLQEQDILVKIDGKEVTDLDAVKSIHKEAIEKLSTRHRMVFSVLRNGMMKQIVLDFARDFSKE